MMLPQKRKTKQQQKNQNNKDIDVMIWENDQSLGQLLTKFNLCLVLMAFASL